MAGKKNTFSPVSRARSSKNCRWNAKERFSMGHDYHSRSLVPYQEPAKENEKPKYFKPKVGVFRAHSFGMSPAERVLEDAKYLVSSNKADSLEEAINTVIESHKNG